MISGDLIQSWSALGCLAPSPHNNQPWSASTDGETLIVSLDDRYLPPLGPDRLQFLALGAFVENVAIAAAADGFAAAVGALPVVPDRAIEVRLSFQASPVTPDGVGAVDAARRRRTNRGGYLAELPSGAMDALSAITPEGGTAVTYLTDPTARHVVAALAARAMEVVFTLPEMRTELAPYVFTVSDPRCDVGMTLASMNPTAREDISGRAWVVELADAEEEGAAARARFEAAPLHFVVTARADTLPSWIAAGRTLQRVLVTATSLGLAHCLAAGPCEIPTLLNRLRDLVPPDTGRPMLLGRLGVPAEPQLSIASPRRAAADVLRRVGTPMSS
jgi:hypothetical protein